MPSSGVWKPENNSQTERTDVHGVCFGEMRSKHWTEEERCYVILDSDWKFSTSGVWIDGYGIVPTEYDAVWIWFGEVAIWSSVAKSRSADAKFFVQKLHFAGVDGSVWLEGNMYTPSTESTCDWKRVPLLDGTADESSTKYWPFALPSHLGWEWIKNKQETHSIC